MTSGGTEASAVPGLQQLLKRHVDLTGDSTRDMARKVDYEIGYQRFHQLLSEPSTRLPYERKVITALSRLLSLPETTIVKAFLVDMGMPIDDRWSRLAQMLPPGVEELDAQDIDAVTYVVRRLVEARQAATSPAAEVPVPPIAELRPPAPNLSVVAARKGKSEGKDSREQQDKDAEPHDED